MREEARRERSSEGGGQEGEKQRGRRQAAREEASSEQEPGRAAREIRSGERTGGGGCEGGQDRGEQGSCPRGRDAPAEGGVPPRKVRREGGRRRRSASRPVGNGPVARTSTAPDIGASSGARSGRLRRPARGSTAGRSLGDWLGAGPESGSHDRCRPHGCSLDGAVKVGAVHHHRPHGNEGSPWVATDRSPPTHGGPSGPSIPRWRWVAA